jgi:hypothetical protein
MKLINLLGWAELMARVMKPSQFTVGRVKKGHTEAVVVEQTI